MIWVLDPLKEFKQQVYNFPIDYVTLMEAKKIKEKMEARVARIEDTLDIVRILRQETRPVEGHDDLEAIENCWEELKNRIKELKK